MTEFAYHPCAILSDGSYSVLAKFSEAANGFEQFESELTGLWLLSERTGILSLRQLAQEASITLQHRLKLLVNLAQI